MGLRFYRLDTRTSRRDILWLWCGRLDRRNGGRLMWGPVGMPFNRKKLRHWIYAAIALYRMGYRG